MTEINKQSLITKLDTLIATLNISTETDNTLSRIYKASINDGETPASIIAEFEPRIEGVSTMTSIEQLLLYSVVTSLITEDRSLVIVDLAELNALTDISAGSVYYVEGERASYIKKTDGSWTKTDPTLQNTEISNGWSWGVNGSGLLGNNSAITSTLSPVSVVGITDWIAIDPGYSHSLALRANGTAWAWGFNATGQLGDGTITYKSSPIPVVGGFANWTQLSSGKFHSLGLRTNGTAWSWGGNAAGQLGDNTVTDASSPVSVVGGFANWTQLSAGAYHNVGLIANGTLWSWGANTNGQLGDGSITTASKSSPVAVVGGFADWTSVSSGALHNLGLRANGTMWAWGGNAAGQLGDNTVTDASSPVSVVGGFTDWIQASCGFGHNLGLRANGTAWAWGYNLKGQLGDGTATDKSSPVAVVGGFADWAQISSGYFHSLGVRTNGSTWAWGYNVAGQLGDNTNINKSSPVAVVGGFTDWVSTSGGSFASFGIRGSNTVPG